MSDTNYKLLGIPKFFLVDRVNHSKKLQKQPPEVFYKKAIFKNLAIFTWKQLF